MFHNEDQRLLYDLIKKHSTCSPAELIKKSDVQKFIGYSRKEHEQKRRILAGRIQFLKKRLKKFGVVLA